MEILGVTVPIWLLSASSFAVAAYVYGAWPFRKLKHTGLPGPKPLPFFGNLIALLKRPFWEVERDLKAKYGKIVQIYEGRMGCIVFYDPAFIKQIVVKEFHNFSGRRRLPLRGPWFKYNLLDLQDAEWKRVRNLLTPLFSSSKLKKKVGLINLSIKSLSSSLKSKVERNEAVELRELCGAFTLDVISSTGYGIQTDSLNNLNDPLVKNVNEIINVSFNHPVFLIIFFLPFLIPILDFFGVESLAKSPMEYMKKLTLKCVMERKSSNEKRFDFVQAMVEAHKEELDHESKMEIKENQLEIDESEERKGLTELEIAAQLVLFYMAGYDTTATALAFFFHSLAYHPFVQERLLIEIDDHFKEGVEPNTENIASLEYLDMCLKESLRLYPSVVRTDRLCAEDIEINGLHIPKGTSCVIPIMALHRDPEYWDEPEKFNPDRFGPDAVREIDPYVYLPFGVGPRSCIGMRLAQLEMKMLIVSILQKYTVGLCSKSKPIELVPHFSLKAKDGLWVKFEQR